MLGPGRQVPEHLVAVVASVRPGPGVNSDVRLQLMHLYKLLPAFLALVRLLPGVDALMDRLLLVGGEPLLAEGAAVTLLAEVRLLVDVSDVPPGERLAAHRAQEGPIWTGTRSSNGNSTKAFASSMATFNSSITG